MADTIFDIASFFSYRGLPFPLNPKGKGSGQAGENITLDNTKAYQRLDYEESDLLGRPIFQPVKLNGIVLPNAQINISFAKKIIETSPTGRRGAINELVTSDNYRITIKGAIVRNNSQEYPIEELEIIEALSQIEDSIIINNQRTDIFGIERVAIKSFSNPSSGMQNIALYEFMCISDFDYELIIE